VVQGGTQRGAFEEAVNEARCNELRTVFRFEMTLVSRSFGHRAEEMFCLTLRDQNLINASRLYYFELSPDDQIGGTLNDVGFS